MKKQVEISIETARKILSGENMLGHLQTMIKETFTEEELNPPPPPKKGFTWEDSFKGHGFWINNGSGIDEGVYTGIESSGTYKKHHNMFATKEQALSALAYAQLTHIVAKYNEGKYFDGYYHVYNCDNKLIKVKEPDILGLLPFYTSEDADISMEVNCELWEQFLMIKK